MKKGRKDASSDAPCPPCKNAAVSACNQSPARIQCAGIDQGLFYGKDGDKPVKILHTADLHLRSADDERWQGLLALAAAGVEQGVDALVIAGDLFDHDADAERLRGPLREVLSDTAFQTVIIPGNHDAAAFQGGRHFGNRVKLLTDPLVPLVIGNVHIHGLPFEPLDSSRVLERLGAVAAVLDRDAVNVLVYHGELLDTFFSRNDFGAEGDSRYMPARLAFFDDLEVDYVLAGHFHSRFDIWPLANKRKGRFVYPGSPAAVTRRETGRRMADLLEAGGDPQGLALDTHHYEEVIVELDPVQHTDPVGRIRERLKGLHPAARALLTVRGLFNGAACGLDEAELAAALEQLKASPRVAEAGGDYRDVRTVLEHDLFRDFSRRLDAADLPEARKTAVRALVLNAMGEVLA